MKKYSYSYKMKNYRNAMKFLECANYIYMSQIEEFELKKVSEYKKSQETFNAIHKDFELVWELLEREQILNAVTILRKVYENITYIIATSFDKNFEVNISILPKKFRSVLEDNCEELFDNLEKEDFENIYNYLCKIVHPCSLKECVAYFENTDKYKKYLLNNIKYVTIFIEYIYVNFFNKKIGLKNELNMSVFEAAGYCSLVNIAYYLTICDKTGRFVKKYFSYDLNSKYLNENQQNAIEFVNSIKKKPKEFENRVNEIAKKADEEIEKSIYKEKVEKILKGNNKKMEGK